MMKSIKSAKEIQEVIFISNLKALHITFSFVVYTFSSIDSIYIRYSLYSWLWKGTDVVGNAITLFFVIPKFNISIVGIYIFNVHEVE